MATTRIMPLHVGKGRTESRAISDIIDYVANPQKTDNGKLITSYACDSRTADAEFLLAKRQYIAATGRVRGADDVIAYTAGRSGGKSLQNTLLGTAGRYTSPRSRSPQSIWYASPGAVRYLRPRFP